MKKFFCQLKPRHYSGSNLEGDRWSSFRWLKNGWDSQVYKDGTRFVQFGKDPIKFISVAPKGEPFKTFLLGARWEVIFHKGRILVGTTIRPKNFTKLWRNIDGNRKKRDGVRTSYKLIR